MWEKGVEIISYRLKYLIEGTCFSIQPVMHDIVEHWFCHFAEMHPPHYWGEEVLGECKNLLSIISSFPQGFINYWIPNVFFARMISLMDGYILLC